MSAWNEEDDNWGVEAEHTSTNNSNQGNTTNTTNHNCGSTITASSKCSNTAASPQSLSYLTLLSGAHQQPLTDVSRAIVTPAMSSGGQQGAAGFKVPPPPPPPPSVVLSSSSPPLSSATRSSSCGTSSPNKPGQERGPMIHNNAPRYVGLPEGERDEDCFERKGAVASHTSAHTALVSPPPPPPQQHSTLASFSASPKQFKLPLPPPPPLPTTIMTTTAAHSTSFTSPKSSAAAATTMRTTTSITGSRTVVLPPPDLGGHVGVHGLAGVAVGVGEGIEREREDRREEVALISNNTNTNTTRTGTNEPPFTSSPAATSSSPFRCGPSHQSPPLQQHQHQQQLVGPKVVTIATIDAPPPPPATTNVFTATATATATASSSPTGTNTTSTGNLTLSSVPSSPSHPPQTRPPPPSLVAPQTLLLPKDYAVEYRQAVRRLYLGYIATHWELSWGRGAGNFETSEKKKEGHPSPTTLSGGGGVVGRTVVDTLSNLVAHGMPRLEDLAKIEIHQLKNKEKERADQKQRGGCREVAVDLKVGTHQQTAADDDEEQLKILENILKTLVEAKKGPSQNGVGGDAVSGSGSNSQHQHQNQQQQRTIKRVAFIKALCAEFSLDATTGGTAQTNAAVRAAAKGNNHQKQQVSAHSHDDADADYDDDDKDAYEQMMRLFHSSAVATASTAAFGRPLRAERNALFFDSEIEHERFDGVFPRLFPRPFLEEELVSALGLAEGIVSAAVHLLNSPSASTSLRHEEKEAVADVGENKPNNAPLREANNNNKRQVSCSSFVIARHIVNSLWQAIRLFAHVLHWIPFFVKEEGEKRRQEEKKERGMNRGGEVEKDKDNKSEDSVSNPAEQRMGDTNATISIALAVSSSCKRARTEQLVLGMRLRCAQGVLQSSQLLLWGKSGRDGDVEGRGDGKGGDVREDLMKPKEGLLPPRSDPHHLDDLDGFSKLEESIAAASMALQQAVPSSAAHWTERQALSLAHNLLKYTKHHRTTTEEKEDSSLLSFLDFFRINPLACVLLGGGCGTCISDGDVREGKDENKKEGNARRTTATRGGVSFSSSLSLSEWMSVCSQTNAVFASHVSTSTVAGSSTRAKTTAAATGGGGGGGGGLFGVAAASSSSLIAAAFVTPRSDASFSSSSFLPVPFTAPTPLPLMTLLLLSTSATAGLELAKAYCRSHGCAAGDGPRAGTTGSNFAACSLLGELMLEGLGSYRVSNTDDSLLSALHLLAAGVGAHANDVSNSNGSSNDANSNTNKMTMSINASGGGTGISSAAHYKETAMYRSAAGALRAESDALLAQLKRLGLSSSCASTHHMNMKSMMTTTTEEERKPFSYVSCLGTMVVPRLFHLLSNLFEIQGENGTDSIPSELLLSSSSSSSLSSLLLLRLKMVAHMVDRCGVQAWSQLAHLTEIENEEKEKEAVQKTATSNECEVYGGNKMKSEYDERGITNATSSSFPFSSASSPRVALKPSEGMACIIRHWYAEWSDLLHKLGISLSSTSFDERGSSDLSQHYSNGNDQRAEGVPLFLLMRRIVKLVTLSSPFFCNAAGGNGTLLTTTNNNNNNNNNAAVSKFLAEAQDILRAIDERVKVLTAVYSGSGSGGGVGLGGLASTQTARQASQQYQQQYERGQEGSTTTTNNNEGELSLLAKTKALVLGLVGECDVSSGLKLSGAVVRVSALAKYVSLFIRREEEEDKANRQRQQQQRFLRQHSINQREPSSLNTGNNRDYYRLHREQIQASVGILTSTITPSTTIHGGESSSSSSCWMLRVLAASPAGDGQLLRLLAQSETCLLNAEVVLTPTTTTTTETPTTHTGSVGSRIRNYSGENILYCNSDDYNHHVCRQWLSKISTASTTVAVASSSSCVAPPSHYLRCQSHLNIAATLETVLLHSKTIHHHHHTTGAGKTRTTTPIMTVAGGDIAVANVDDVNNHDDDKTYPYYAKEIASATALLNPSEMCILVLEHLRNALSCAYHPSAHHASDLTDNNKNKSSSPLTVDKVLELRVRLIRARTLYNLRKFMSQQQQRHHQHHHHQNPHQINTSSFEADPSSAAAFGVSSPHLHSPLAGAPSFDEGGQGGSTLIPAAVFSGASAAYSYYYLNHHSSSSNSAGGCINQEEGIVADFEAAASADTAGATAAALLSPAFAAANDKLRQVLLRSLLTCTSSVSSSSSRNPPLGGEGGGGRASTAAAIAAEAAVAGKGAPIIIAQPTAACLSPTSPSSSLVTLDDALAREMQWLEGGGLNVASSSVMSSVSTADAAATSSSSSSDDDDDVDSVDESDPKAKGKRGGGPHLSTRRRRRRDEGQGRVEFGNDYLLSSTRPLLNVLECAAATLASSASSSCQGQRAERPATIKIGSKRLREEADAQQRETEGERVPHGNSVNTGIGIGIGSSIGSSIGTYLSYALLKAHVLLDEQSGGAGDYLSAEALARAVLKVATVAVDATTTSTGILWAAPFISEGCRLLAACITIAKRGQGPLEMSGNDTDDDDDDDNVADDNALPRPHHPSSTVRMVHPPHLCSILRNLNASNNPRFLMKVSVTVSSMAGLSRSEHQSLHWALTNELGDHYDAGDDGLDAEKKITRKKAARKEEGGENEKYLATISPAAWGAAQSRYDQQVRAVFTGLGGTKSGGGGSGNSFASLPAALDRLAAHLPGLVADY